MRYIIPFLLASAALAQSTVTIGPAVFSGAGLNDAHSAGRYTPAAANAQYLVVQSAAGTPDQFEWSKNGGTGSSPVNMIAGCVTLTDGAQFCTTASTGHGTSAGTITAATWAVDSATYTTSAPHGLVNGQNVFVSGVSPSGYNVPCAALVIDASDFSCLVASSPGSYTSGGTVTASGAWTINAQASGTAGTFVASGQGSLVTRAGQAKMQESLSVLDKGAVADGVTDSTAAFNAAYRSLQPGGTIHVPASPTGACYMVTYIYQRTGVSLVGDGSASTCIKQIAQPGVSRAVVDIDYSVSTLGYNPYAPHENMLLQGLTIDGNRLAQSGISGDGDSVGIWLHGASNVTLRDIHVKNVYTDGVYLVGAGPNQDMCGGNILFDNVHVDYSRRNNFGIICTTGLKVVNSSGNHAGPLGAQAGTAPMHGIGIEPNIASQPVDNISIASSDFVGNSSGGIYAALTAAEPNFNLTIDPTVTADSLNLFSNTLTVVTGPIKLGGTYLAAGRAVGIDLSYMAGALVSDAITSGATEGMRIDSHTSGTLVSNSVLSGTLYDLLFDAASTNNTVACGVVLSDHTIDDGTQFAASGNRYCDGIDQLDTSQVAGPVDSIRLASAEVTFLPGYGDHRILFSLGTIGSAATTYVDYAAIQGGPDYTGLDAGGHLYLLTANAAGAMTTGLWQDKYQMDHLSAANVASLGVGFDPLNSALLPYISPSPQIAQCNATGNFACSEAISPLTVLFGAGTVQVTLANNLATGTGTSWTSASVGGILQIGAFSALVTSWTDSTHLHFSPSFTGTTASLLTYSIVAQPYYWYWSSANGTTNTDYILHGFGALGATSFLFGNDGRLAIPGTFAGNAGVFATSLTVGGASVLTSGGLSGYALLSSANFTALQLGGANVATQSYVAGLGYATSASVASTYAPLASPTFTGSITNAAAGLYAWSGRSYMTSRADGVVAFNRNSGATHLFAQVFASTYSSGFGTTPSVSGIDSAGRVTVGTGGTATTGAINFGIAWNTAPSCIANDETTTSLLVSATATTSSLTLTSPTAWGAADKLTWICFSN